MSFLKSLVQAAEGLGRQVNPFDGGATWQNPAGRNVSPPGRVGRPGPETYTQYLYNNQALDRQNKVMTPQQYAEQVQATNEMAQSIGRAIPLGIGQLQPVPMLGQENNLQRGGYNPQTTADSYFSPGQGGQYYEDSYTPADALFNTGYINPQTTLHGNFIQSDQANGQYPNYVNHPAYQRLQVMHDVFKSLGF